MIFKDIQYCRKCKEKMCGHIEKSCELKQLLLLRVYLSVKNSIVNLLAHSLAVVAQLGPLFVKENIFWVLWLINKHTQKVIRFCPNLLRSPCTYLIFRQNPFVAQFLKRRSLPELLDPSFTIPSGRRLVQPWNPTSCSWPRGAYFTIFRVSPVKFPQIW